MKEAILTITQETLCEALTYWLQQDIMKFGTFTKVVAVTSLDQADSNFELELKTPEKKP